MIIEHECTPLPFLNLSSPLKCLSFFGSFFNRKLFLWWAKQKMIIGLSLQSSSFKFSPSNRCQSASLTAQEFLKGSDQGAISCLTYHCPSAGSLPPDWVTTPITIFLKISSLKPRPRVSSRIVVLKQKLVTVDMRRIKTVFWGAHPSKFSLAFASCEKRTCCITAA